MLLLEKRQPLTGVSRKRKLLVPDECRAKRARCAWTELEYELVLEDAALLHEELELLVLVALDLCKDLGHDDTSVRTFAAALEHIDARLASSQALRVPEIRDMCQQMLTIMQHLCHVHYHHFALVDMQEALRDCRNRFMLFICKNAAMLGL
ncbi:hypothetical protein PsorP6_005616 [Peronosclerospora sorghi]|uniref:Uncharacterized protein n=1 Tax=Peronosclerospora sorghi TaxID=230839 RepID=A0ACC0W298_9STRA|nr:hypothetical protein PsorP6_005616 [Peronosclerospora sorghi]